MSVNLKTINLKILTGRVAGIAMAAVLGALEKSGIPHDERGVLAVAGVALVAVVAKAPDIFAAAGIVRPLSPAQASLYQKALAGVQTLIRTPAAKRRQKAKDMAVQGFQAALADPALRERLTLELQRAQLWQPGQPAPGSSAPDQTELKAPERPAARLFVLPDDRSITQTGGNQ